MIDRPIISLLHPTARIKPSKGFPRGYSAAHDVWLARADHPERIEYVLAVHASRWHDYVERRELEGVDATSWSRFCVVRNEGRDCVVDQLNAAAKASTGLLMMGVQDDVTPPQHWDTLVLNALPTNVETRGPDLASECVLHFSSGSPRDGELMVAGAITRARYQRYGYALNPEFESMRADDYLTWQARRDAEAGICILINRQDILFEHHHPSFSKGEWDEIYALQNRAQAYHQGLATFLNLTQGTRVISALLPGEAFSHWYTSSLVELMCHLEKGPRFLVDRWYAHSSSVYQTRINLADWCLTKARKPDLIYLQDDDNPVSIDQFEMLLATLDAHPELDGVVGWCWCDTGDYETGQFRMSCGRQGEGLTCLHFTLDDLNKAIDTGKLAITSDDIAPYAFWSGLPVALFRASVFERLGWEAFLPMLGEHYHRKHTSEDTTFFYHAAQAGMKFAVDLRVKVPHLKLRAIEPRYLPDGAWEQVLSGQWMRPKKPPSTVPLEEPLFASAAD